MTYVPFEPGPKSCSSEWPFFSPDGTSVGFYADGALKTVALAGGTSQIVCAVPFVYGATWLDDGTIVFGGPGLQQVSAAGGIPLAITTTRNTEGEIFRTSPTSLPGAGSPVPEWSPDGEELFYMNLNGSHLMSVPSSNGETLMHGTPSAT